MLFLCMRFLFNNELGECGVRKLHDFSHKICAANKCERKHFIS